ncbi:hypothetical protein TW81_09980 [Vibrio galatheae]|uniref:Uncharacterized protein n=1 Tax=Vibrio galatheae TaxID=579748 RepID=A0A0F4NKA6_9VIBR|nr:hypothetical protein [Vibrio galatheae]KJY83313.1 hypothetical protein TW81_09980 [Vibrio galatheae]
MTDLDLEFEHIYLEVKAERWQQIERFLFSYYCFREGLVTNNNKPDWETARKNATRSKKVQQAGLQTAMPAYWYQNADKDPFARFNQVSIALNTASPHDNDPASNTASISRL